MSKQLIENLVGEKKALQHKIQEMESKLNAYTNLGSPEKINEAFDRILQFKESLKGSALGNSEKDELEQYRELGDPRRISEALDRSFNLLNSYKDLGSPDQIWEALDEAIDLITKYKELGTPDEIDEILENYRERLVETKCDKLAVKYNTSTGTVRKMFESINNFDTVDELLNDTLNSGRPNTRDDQETIDESYKPSETKVSMINRVCKHLM